MKKTWINETHLEFEFKFYMCTSCTWYIKNTLSLYNWNESNLKFSNKLVQPLCSNFEQNPIS
jgi:hypothetical protein